VPGVAKRAHASALEDAYVLRARKRVIADLVAGGLTHREIAPTLHIAG
jgi:DNA-binding NarL/FixJ family response regulator